MMDRIGMRFSLQNNVQVVGLRYFNVYGTNEFFKGKTASMVLQFGFQILSGKAPCLFNGSDTILRDFVYINDVLQANEKTMNSNVSGVFNVGTGKARSFQDIADILQNELGVDFGNTYIPNPFTSQYQFYTEADIQDTCRILKYKSKFTLEDGVRDYLPEIKRIFKDELNG
jgi:ADP-L-glycero-D-manno-heptose-6-epimerase